ncbi:MAG: hypothetical protein WEE64_11660 [Dehalococcoidia bacterium]
MRSQIRTALLLAATLLALTVAVACDDHEPASEAAVTPTEAVSVTIVSPTASETDPTSGNSLDLPYETGEDPIFWRTSDQFASVQTDQSYKLVLRVTNGYQQESLPLRAERGGASVEFEARRATPTGEDDAGSYYVVNLVFPQAGSWQLTASAGADEATVPVDVAPAGGATG